MAAAATTPLFNHTTSTTGSGTALEPVRMRCTACRGSGIATAAIEPMCTACGISWPASTFDTWLESHDRGGVTHWRGWQLPTWLVRLTRAVSFFVPGGRDDYRWDCTLPCGHDLAANLSYHTPDCPHCRGCGTVASWQLSARYLRAIHRQETQPTIRQQQHRRNPPSVPPIRSTPHLRPAVRRLLWEERDTDVNSASHSASTNA